LRTRVPGRATGPPAWLPGTRRHSQGARMTSAWPRRRAASMASPQPRARAQFEGHRARSRSGPGGTRPRLPAAPSAWSWPVRASTLQRTPEAPFWHKSVRYGELDRGMQIGVLCSPPGFLRARPAEACAGRRIRTPGDGRWLLTGGNWSTGEPTDHRTQRRRAGARPG
jgi:hypothetical protein